MWNLLLNSYAWVCVAFLVVGLLDIARGGSIWVVWFLLAIVFGVIAYRRPTRGDTARDEDAAVDDDPSRAP